jgi:hypothetical protein
LTQLYSADDQYLIVIVGALHEKCGEGDFAAGVTGRKESA